MGPPTQRLGRYHLSECLGGGPTGEVYRAKVYGVAGMDRDFAVKRFHPTFMTGSAAAAEIAVAARLYGALDHRKVAKLQEYGVSGELTFTAVEFVPGIDLAQLVDHGPLPLGAAAQLIAQVARAVGYAHGRGVNHLGLAPTNVICSERGEIKVTDFGFLPPRLPSRPADDVSLHSRLCYLAPEQLEGIETSSATDVYQLGTIAYELMVGRKPYARRTGVALAEQMLGGAVPNSGLPKSFQEFLQRALARSPLERFSDAGAMADAIEAALRSSPTRGGLMDAGKAVTARKEFLAGQRESQASGVLSFPIPAPPQAPREEVLDIVSPPPVPAKKSLGRIKLNKIPVIAPRTPPIPERPASQFIELDLVNDTLDEESIDEVTDTSLEKTSVPSMEVPVIENDPIPQEDSSMLLGPAGTDAAATREQFIGGEAQVRSGSHNIARGPNAPSTDRVGEESDSLDIAETLVQLTPGAQDSGLDLLADGGPPLAMPPSIATPPEAPAPTPAPPGIAPANVQLGSTPPPPPVPTAPIMSPDPEAPPPIAPVMSPGSAAPVRRGVPRALVYAAIAMVVGAAGFFTFTLLSASDVDGPTVAKAATTDGAGQPEPNTRIAPVAPVVDAAPPDEPGNALLAASGDAALAEPNDSKPPTAGSSDKLEVASEPSGAKVYLDGTLVGTTPVHLDASPDRHRLALILPGYALYTGDIDGSGIFKIDLHEVTPPEGPGGIKVRCKKTNRYYVFIDGKPVGQLCPSERIGVSKGQHVVEIYDPITDARRAFNVDVVDTRLSLRIRVD